MLMFFVATAEDDSDIGAKVEPDQLDLFASPLCSAGPGVQTLPRPPSFFADTPLPGSQLVATASNVHVHAESTEPQLSRMTLMSPFPRQVVHSRVLPPFQLPVFTLPQWHPAPQYGPMPPPAVSLWTKPAQDVIMDEASANHLRSQVVEPLYHQPGPAFTSFAAFTTTTTAAPPQVLLDVPMSPPPVHIEPRDEEILPGWRMWRAARSLPRPCTTPVRMAPVSRSPQPPPTPDFLLGEDDCDEEDDCIITLTQPGPGPEKAPEAMQAEAEQEQDEAFDPLFDEAPSASASASEDAQPQVTSMEMELAQTVVVPQMHPVSAVPAPFVVQLPAMGPVQSPPIWDVEMGSSDSGVQHMGLPHVLSVIRPLHVPVSFPAPIPVPVHDVIMAVAQPPAGEARSPRIVDVEMEGDVGVVQVGQQPLCLGPSHTAVVPIQPRTTETSVASTGDKEQKERELEKELEKDAEDAELLRELRAMRRNPNEWNVRPVVALDLSPAPTVFGSDVKIASVTFALAGLTLSSDVSEVDSEDDDEDEGESTHRTLVCADRLQSSYPIQDFPMVHPSPTGPWHWRARPRKQTSAASRNLSPS